MEAAENLSDLFTSRAVGFRLWIDQKFAEAINHFRANLDDDKNDILALLSYRSLLLENPKLVPTPATADLQAQLLARAKAIPKSVTENALKELEGETDAHYLFLRGVINDLVLDRATQALKYYKEAADLGYPGAINNLAVYYSGGQGTPKNANLAMDLYRQAADMGYTVSLFNLGVCYQRGEGCERDLEKAFHYYQLAADNRDADAMTNLGVCYQEGRGVNKDVAKGIVWYKAAAEQGVALAQFNLGWCYCTGSGIDVDKHEGIRYYKYSAAQDHASALTNLGWCFEHGFGVNKDLAEALRLYRQAAARGSTTARDNVQILGDHLIVSVPQGEESDPPL